MVKNGSLTIEESVDGLIYLLHGQRVMFDADLAVLYGVSTKVLNQAVKRNTERFPSDFMFQVDEEDFSKFLRSQFVTSKLSDGRGGRRYLPFVR